MPQMTTRRMLIACWITKATDTHSEYVIFIAPSRQQWLGERASVLRYTYIASLVLPSEILKDSAVFVGDFSLSLDAFCSSCFS